jgi:uncharacterized membrane protein HdeD (DUF308 family)
VSYFFTANAQTMSPSQVKTIRLVIVIAGIVAVVVGVAILVWPEATLALVAWLFGVYFIVSGIARVVKAVMTRDVAGSYRAFLAIFGLLLIVGGAFVLANPMFGVTVVATIIGFTWILEGPGSPFYSGWSVSRLVLSCCSPLSRRRCSGCKSRLFCSLSPA